LVGNLENMEKDLAEIFGVPYNRVTNITKIKSEFLRFEIKLNYPSCFMDKRFENLSDYVKTNDLKKWFLASILNGIEISFPKK
jgi:hypothetical protein